MPRTCEGRRGRQALVLLCLALPGACGDAAGTAAESQAGGSASSPVVADSGDAATRSGLASDALIRGEVWQRELFGAGVSSPRVLHVDDDGVLDIVVGLGKEFQWGALVALSGADGHELWRHEVIDEVYATPCLLDLDGDGDLDVVAGRRVGPAAGLVAVDGRSGEKLWGLASANPDLSLPALHFNTSIPCPDVDGDGLGDLIALQGGGRDEAREASRIHLVKSDTGRILETVETPDGAESFFVPSLERLPGEPERWRLLIATGGETLPGQVFSLDFPELSVQWSYDAGGARKGFVASGLLHDFDGQGRDAVVSAFNSSLRRLDGDTGAEVWKLRFPGMETYVTPTPGHFGGDDTIDVVSLFSEGRWPDYTTRNVLAWVDGASGEVLFQRDRGVQASSCPVVFDLDGDGWDEVLLVNNLAFSMNKKEVPCQLDLYDGGPGKQLLATRRFEGYSAATPWIGHLDDDGLMDVVFVHLNSACRISLGPVPAARIHWNEYRGPRQDGVVPRRDRPGG